MLKYYLCKKNMALNIFLRNKLREKLQIIALNKV